MFLGIQEDDMQQPGIRKSEFPLRTPRLRRSFLRSVALTLGALAFLLGVASNGLTPMRAESKPALAANPAAFTTTEAHGLWTHFSPPADAPNLALRSAGAWATASTTGDKFDPNGALDGNWTVRDWGKGHGWQNAKRHEYPSWLDIHLPRAEEIDAVVVQTFPEVSHGVNWAGIRNADIQVKYEGKWATLGEAGSMRANVKGTIVQRFAPMHVDELRILVLGVNTGQQEDVFYDDDDFARILQVGIYRVHTPYPFVDEQVSAQVERGPSGRVAIYRDNLPVKPANSSSPEALAALFRKAGYGVTFLDSKELCVPEIFNRENFDVFVQPYGAPFPVGSALYQFLSAGGHLITLGGHPFRQALMFDFQGKLVDAGYDAGITTSVARQSDYKLPFREQLGMFYTGYERLENVSYVAPAPDQEIVKSSFKLNAHLEGAVAAGYVGDRLSIDEGERLTREGTFAEYANAARRGVSNFVSIVNDSPGGVSFNDQDGYIFNWPRSRWIPLVNSYDRLGHLRGSVVSVLANYRGIYRGSGWIYCGVENMDLFSADHPEFGQVLLDAVRYLESSAGLHDVLPELDCYYQGETAKVAATVENYQPTKRHLAVNFELIASGAKSPVYSKRVELDVPPNSNARPSASWNPPHYDSDYYLIRATLYDGQRQLDTSESAFVVWDPRVIAQGPTVDFHDNYFHRNGKRQLLIGSRTNGIEPKGQVDEDVLGWERQYSQMYDNGIRVFSSVYFSIYISGLAWGQPQNPIIPVPLQRQMDAQVFLAQKHHLIFAPDIFFFAKNAAMQRMELSRRLCAEVGKRYASVPGMMFYIFDDGTPKTPLQQYQDWSKNCLDAFWSSGRKYIVLGETEGVGMERYGSQALAMPANGNYHPGQPAIFRTLDMRAAGKSFHLSEFGVNSPGAKPGDIDLHTYPGNNVSGSVAGDYSVYLTQPHFNFGLGGAYVLDWVWKDTAHLIFPWGITHPNDYLATRPLLAFRNDSYFLRHFQPEFHFPKTLVVLPKQRVIRDEAAYLPGLLDMMSTLFDRGVQFATIDDTDLDRIPAGPHVLIYLDPEYAVPEVIEKLQARAEAGDEVFITGDFSQPLEAGGTRQTELFARLAGLRWLGDYERGSEIPLAPVLGTGVLNPYIGHPRSMFEASGAQVLARDPEGHAVIALRELGSGHVFFTSDSGLDGVRRALDDFLQLRAVPATDLSPRQANRDIFEVDRMGGGKIYTLAATRPDGDKYALNGPWIDHPESFVLNTGNQRVDVPLGALGLSVLATRQDGHVDALEGQGKFNVDGATLAEAEPHVMIMSLDDAELSKSHALGLFALGVGKVALAVPEDVDVVEVGDINDGQFQPVEEVKTTREDGRLTFQLDDVQVRGVLLITSKAERDHARQLMTAALQ
jgi:hypothetical protein